ncbi:MAG: ABC transporter ATP-binding protein, partial [Bacteroidota bacterium]
MAVNEKTDEKPKFSREQFSRSLRIFQYVLPYKWYFIAGMFILALGSLVFLVIMQLPGEVLNVITGEATHNYTIN